MWATLAPRPRDAVGGLRCLSGLLLPNRALIGFLSHARQSREQICKTKHNVNKKTYHNKAMMGLKKTSSGNDLSFTPLWTSPLSSMEWCRCSVHCPEGVSLSAAQSNRQSGALKANGPFSLPTTTWKKDAGAASNTDPDAPRFEITSEQR